VDLIPARPAGAAEGGEGEEAVSAHDDGDGDERLCICADPENCTERVPGYVCRRDVDSADDLAAAQERAAVRQQVELPPMMAAGLLLSLKAECEQQHARAEAAESEVEALRAALAAMTHRFEAAQRVMQDAYWRAEAAEEKLAALARTEGR
jgi:hypothetical protein